jgi:magnesium-transporting ATPase (P-type)
MAMGDGENDLEMLQLAGLSIAMGNAGRRLKAVADFVVGTNDQVISFRPRIEALLQQLCDIILINQSSGWRC